MRHQYTLQYEEECVASHIVQSEVMLSDLVSPSASEMGGYGGGDGVGYSGGYDGGEGGGDEEGYSDGERGGDGEEVGQKQ